MKTTSFLHLLSKQTSYISSWPRIYFFPLVQTDGRVTEHPCVVLFLFHHPKLNKKNGNEIKKTSEGITLHIHNSWFMFTCAGAKAVAFFSSNSCLARLIFFLSILCAASGNMTEEIDCATAVSVSYKLAVGGRWGGERTKRTWSATHFWRAHGNVSPLLEKQWSRS